MTELQFQRDSILHNHTGALSLDPISHTFWIWQYRRVMHSCSAECGHT